MDMRQTRARSARQCLGFKNLLLKTTRATFQWLESQFISIQTLINTTFDQYSLDQPRIGLNSPHLRRLLALSPSFLDLGDRAIGRSALDRQAKITILSEKVLGPDCPLLR